MNSQELLESMRQEVARVKATGQQGVTLDDLDNYFSRFQQCTSAGSSDQLTVAPQKAQYEMALAHYNWQKDSSLEMFRSVINAGQSALKAAMLMNGGAAVALLALLGHAASDASTKSLVAKLASPLFLFVLGVLSSCVATGVNYVTQSLHSRRNTKIAHTTNVVGMLLVAAAYSVFAYASYVAYQVFAHV